MSYMNQGLEMLGKRIVAEGVSDFEFVDSMKFYSKLKPRFHINDLPDECLYNIFSYLPIEDVMSAKDGELCYFLHKEKKSLSF